VLTTLAAEPDWSIQRLFDWAEGRSLAPLKGTGWGGGIAYPHQPISPLPPISGTPVQPHLDGVILALEDVEPYRPTADAVALLWCVVKVKALHWGF